MRAPLGMTADARLGRQAGVFRNADLAAAIRARRSSRPAYRSLSLKTTWIARDTTRRALAVTRKPKRNARRRPVDAPAGSRRPVSGWSLLLGRRRARVAA